MRVLIFFLFFIISFCTKGQDASHLNNEIKSSYTFHYEDIENFREVLAIAKNKGDTLNALKNYFDKGSLGMKAWIKRYDHITPELMVKCIKYFPKYYSNLATIDSHLKNYETQITEGLNGLKALYPSEFVYFPPIYYFILFSGGGSVEMTANIISVDYFGYYDNMDISEFDRIGGLFPKGKFSLVNHIN